MASRHRTQAIRSRESNRDAAFITALTVTAFGIYRCLLRAVNHWVLPFDSSHTIETAGVPPPALRWDAIHFLSIAKRGYEFEQQLAFQPGWHAILAAAGRVMAAIKRGDASSVDHVDLVQGALAVNLVARVIANVYLYRLTTSLFSRRMAFVSSLLYAATPTPAVIVSPYTESIYGAFTFSAMFYSVTGRYLAAAVLFAGATSIRATGVFACGVLALHVMFSKASSCTLSKILARLIWISVLCLLIIMPFIAFQIYNYHAFCYPVATRPWCGLKLPLSYSWVQREYWNVGFVRYWTVQQLPNFFLAAPVLVPSVIGLSRYLSRQPLSLDSLSSDPRLPIYLHQLFMTVMLVVSSHTQIALRLAVTDPVIWWTVAASLLSTTSKGVPQCSGKLAQFWVWWTSTWSLLSLVLWSGHYPPA